jgi:hypothetical protein
MSDDIQQVKHDISYLKEIAGDDGMVLRASGIGLMVGGIVFPLVGLRFHLMTNGIIDWPDALEFLIPGDGVVLFFITLFTCFYLDGKGKNMAPPKVNAASRAMWVGWAAVGVGYLVTQIAMSQAGEGSLAVLSLFAFWGGGWAVVWAIYRHGLLLVLTIACYVLTILVGVYWESEVKTLLMFVGWLGLVALPGFFIYRYARSLQA